MGIVARIALVHSTGTMMPVMPAVRRHIAPEPSGFAARWLAEMVRLREAGGGVGDDGAAMAAARQAPGDIERRILIRAARLAEASGQTADRFAWQGVARVLLLVLLLLAFVGGFASVASVIGFGAGTINVVWALFGLLGLPTLMLALWLLSLLAGGAASGGGGGIPGRLWLWLSERTWRGRDRTAVARGLFALLSSAGLLRWVLGAVSHGMWALALVGALIGLGLALSVWQYGFAWQTTILPASAFVLIVDVVGWLPGLFGFATPDAELVRASGGAMVPDQDARHVWASWLTGAVLIYGLLPRLALLAFCLARIRIGAARFRLDLGQPYYAALAARLAPASERLGVLDADDHAAGMPRLAEPHPTDSRAGALIAVEWPQLPPGWPTQPARSGWVERIDGRASRQRVASRLAADPPARLLLACNPQLSPDRGTQALIAALSQHAGDTRVWLPDLGDANDRRDRWRRALEDLGLPLAHVYGDGAAALAWVALDGERS